MKALIFAGGAFSRLPEDVLPKAYDLVIAADKGYVYAEAAGLIPDIAVGDFDSLAEAVEIKSPEIIRLCPEKDMTDTQEAISVAISRGAKEILVLGALGGRMDHTLANIQLLKFGLDRGAAVTLKDEACEITLIHEPHTFSKKENVYLSLIPLTPCHHVTVSGVSYPLADGTLALGDSLGVSNEFASAVAEIDPGNGLLLVLFCKKDSQ